MAHLLVAISAHGYGHLAQVAPVLQALRARRPALRITLLGNLPPAVLRQRLPADIQHLPMATDVALPMDGPLKVLWTEGLARYEAFEAAYAEHFARQRALLLALRPDAVLADVPWLPLDGARALDIPALALCSLNWYDILAQSPVGALLSESLTARLRSVYAQARHFVRPAPSMPMDWLPNGLDVGPIALRGQRAPEALRARFGIAPSIKLVLMQFGGAGHLPLGPAARELAGRLRILTPDRTAANAWPGATELFLPFEPNGRGDMSPLDILASCDALITKPGYGAFAEAACHGLPVLVVRRDTWPETPALMDWLERQVPLRLIDAEQLASGDIGAPLADLFAAGLAPPLAPTGIDACADLINAWLSPA